MNLSVDTFFKIIPERFKQLFEAQESAWTPLIHLERFFETLGKAKQLTKIPQGVWLENPESIWIEENIRLEPGCYIQGPAFIGKGSIIRHGAYVRSFSLIAEQCLIGHASEIKHSILLPGAKAAHFNYVGDSILGAGVNLGSGATCANVRLDRQEIQVRFKQKKIPTGLNKLGLIIGDESQLGCHCVTNPGTVLFPRQFIHPNQTISGVHPHAN